MAIKPNFATLILDHKKAYEFRKLIFKRKNITRVNVYATSPISKVIGYFDIDEILKDTPQKLWIDLGKYSGLSRPEFFEYFKGYYYGYAIKIKNPFKYPTPKLLREIHPDLKPPQNFCYIPIRNKMGDFK
jgi:type I restriction enzyme S subunit